MNRHLASFLMVLCPAASACWQPPRRNPISPTRLHLVRGWAQLVHGELHHVGGAFKDSSTHVQLGVGSGSEHDGQVGLRADRIWSITHMPRSRRTPCRPVARRFRWFLGSSFSVPFDLLACLPGCGLPVACLLWSPAVAHVGRTLRRFCRLALSLLKCFRFEVSPIRCRQCRQGCVRCWRAQFPVLSDRPASSPVIIIFVEAVGSGTSSFVVRWCSPLRQGILNSSLSVRPRMYAKRCDFDGAVVHVALELVRPGHVQKAHHIADQIWIKLFVQCKGKSKAFSASSSWSGQDNAAYLPILEYAYRFRHCKGMNCQLPAGRCLNVMVCDSMALTYVILTSRFSTHRLAERKE